MKRLTITLALLLGLIVGQALPDTGRWTFPSLMDLFSGVPVSATYRPSVIKSIQRALITLNNVTSNTATVTSVDTANSILIFNGATWGTTNTDGRQMFVAIVLTNATTVTATSNTAFAADHIASFDLVEYYPGAAIKSLQRGTVTGTASPNTATITAVVMNRSSVYQGGLTANSTLTPQGDTISWYLKLATTTTVTLTYPNQAGGAIVAPYQVVEWK